MTRIVKWAVALGFCSLFTSVAGLSPAIADDWRYDRDRREIRNDIRDIRGDERRLRDLEYRRDEARRCRNWGELRRLDIQIDDLRIHISRDQRELHRDFERAGYQDRDRDGYRDRDRNRDWDRDRRW